MIEIKDLSINIHGKRILDKVNLSVDEGQWLMIVGPNGAGKSSLIKAIAGIYPYTGQIQLMDRPINDYRPKERAKNLAILSQRGPMIDSYNVREIVELGRYAYNSSFLSRLSNEDQDFVDYALDLTGMTHLAQASLNQLSGGELQRTFLAQVFAQNPKLLILDEPSNHLDLNYEKIIFETVATWLQEANRCVLSIVHDLSLALKYGNQGLLLNQGQVHAYGDIRSSLSNENLSQVYQMDVADYFLDKHKYWLERS